MLNEESAPRESERERVSSSLLLLPILILLFISFLDVSSVPTVDVDCPLLTSALSHPLAPFSAIPQIFCVVWTTRKDRRREFLHFSFFEKRKKKKIKTEKKFPVMIVCRRRLNDQCPGRRPSARRTVVFYSLA